MEANGANPLKHKPQRNKELKRLQVQQRGAAKDERRLSVLKANKLIYGLIWSESDQIQLISSVTKCADLGDEISKKRMAIKDKLAKNRKLKEECSRDRFWRLAKRVTKNKGLLSALKAPDGRLVTELMS